MLVVTEESHQQRDPLADNDTLLCSSHGSLLEADVSAQFGRPARMATGHRPLPEA